MKELKDLKIDVQLNKIIEEPLQSNENELAVMVSKHAFEHTLKLNSSNNFAPRIGDQDDGEVSDGLCEGTELDQSLYWM